MMQMVKAGVVLLLGAVGLATEIGLSSAVAQDTPKLTQPGAGLLERMVANRPAMYVEPTGPMTSITYADGIERTYDTETRWRAMCGSSPLTEAQLKTMAETHAAQMADQANILVIDTPQTGAATRGAGVNIVFNVNTTNMPSGAAASFTAAEAYIESVFADPITITISVSWANLGSGVIGATGSNYVNSVAYSTSRTGLINGQDADDTIQDFLPTGTTVPVRYDASSATVTNESVVFWTRSNYKSTVGTSAGTDCSMQYNSTFSFDFDPSNGVGGSLLSLVDTIVHETGHCMGFTSAADFRTADIETLDLYRFARVDRAAIGDTNPDTTAEFQTTAREVEINDPTNDDVISDIISAEYRMSDGDPRQASHFFDQGSAIGIMDPTLANGQTFYPNFFRTSDINMFDAIGWDYATCSTPGITVQPSPVSVCTGAAINLSVTATGATGYQWRKNTVNISGATSSTYAIAISAAGDAGSYDVVVSNACGNTTSNAVAVAVGSAPVIASQPASIARCTGSSASFSVSMSVAGTYTYQWRKGVSNIVGATSPTYTIPSVVAGDAATYTCFITNTCGNVTTNNATLSVTESVNISGNPSSLVRCVGSSASFSVTATGTSPAFQWQLDGLDIPGANSPTLNVNPVSLADQGEYTCIVGNLCGNLTSNPAILTVNVAPSFNTSPSSQVLCAGSPVTFTASATGSPAPSLQWRRNGINIGGATGTSYSIPSVSVGNQGTYDCVATNSCTSVTSGGALLTVNDVPQISLQPSAQGVCEGQPFSFSVAATTTVTYQWRKNLANISGATGPTFAGTATLGDVGSYDCVLTNSCGSTTSNAVALTVNDGPQITTQPTGSTVNSGAPAALSVVATGSPAVTYQWRRNTVDLSDTGPYTGTGTSTLNIAAVTNAEAGSFDVVVTNTCGTATSNAAVIDIATGCPADLDNGSGTGTPDGGIDINDLLYFLNKFEAGAIDADLDNGSGLGVPDGGIDINDLLFFLSHFEGGC
jgi:hypothetical protein